MAHGYFETDFGIVWDTISIEIPELITTLSTLKTKVAARDRDRSEP